MNLISDKISKVAKLAKLALTDHEQATFAPQLDNLIAYLENLNGLNTTKVEPTRQVTGLSNVTRADVVATCNIQEGLLACSPLEKENRHIVVPSVFA